MPTAPNRFSCPDWSHRGTPEELESWVKLENTDTQWKFRGEGWYIYAESTILLVANQQGSYTFCYWGRKNVLADFSEIANLGIRNCTCPIADEDTIWEAYCKQTEPPENSNA